MRFLLPAIPFAQLAAGLALVAAVRAVRLPEPVALLIAGGLLVEPALRTARDVVDEFDHPDWRTELEPMLLRNAGPPHRSVEFLYPMGDRLFDSADPWTELQLPTPDDPERVARIRSELIAAGRLLPATPLESLLRSAPSLAALQETLARGGFDRLVISVPLRYSTDLDRMLEPAPLAWLHACACWKEAFLWFATLPMVDTLLSDDKTTVACVLDLPAAQESAR
jgi:hypothetical protein